MVGANGLSALDAISESTAGFAPIALAGGSTIVLTAVGRFAAPVGHPVHRHAPAIAGLLGATFTAAATKNYAAAMVALLVGGGIWSAERLLEWQAYRLLPQAAAR